MQVSPTEIEQLLAQIDGIDDVAVVGIRDDRLGEVPRAYVVVVDEKKKTALTSEYIEQYIRGYIFSIIQSHFCLHFRSTGTA